MDRNQAIDVYRGSAIVGMVFFTLTLKLSFGLPDPLKHNAYGTLHLGDLVLPMFLFASGLSLAFFQEKYKGQLSEQVSKRFLRLAVVGVLLSPFSTWAPFQMDEVLLCAILFLACVVLSKLDWRMHLIIIFVINCSYLLLMHYQMDEIFYEQYLGGYPAALYYLPVMLVGFDIGNGIINGHLYSKRNIATIGVIACNFLVFWLLIPIDKLIATPSFMMLAILFCFVLLVIIYKLLENIGGMEELEYLGRNPFRYWIMMYVLLIIPLRLYTDNQFPMDIHWLAGVMLSIAALLILVLLSKVIDKIKRK